MQGSGFFLRFPLLLGEQFPERALEHLREPEALQGAIEGQDDGPPGQPTMDRVANLV